MSEGGEGGKGDKRVTDGEGKEETGKDKTQESTNTLVHLSECMYVSYMYVQGASCSAGTSIVSCSSSS